MGSAYRLAGQHSFLQEGFDFAVLKVLCLLVLASAYLINANDFTNRSDAALLSNEEEGVDEIIGGATVARGQHQYMAYLRSFYRYSPGFYSGCGGTVISNRYILTAAHCVQHHKTGEIANKVEVRLKVYTIDPMDAGAKLITVTGSGIKPHPQFATKNGVANYNFDIALIKLNADLPTSDYYLIGKLYTSTYQQYYNYNGPVTAVGWGLTSSSAHDLSPTLQKVDFTIGTKRECSGYWSPIKRYYDHIYQMCGVTPGKSTCQGDSGGPIVRYSSALKTYFQIGITSFGLGFNRRSQCEKGFAVFTRVSVHRDWIDRNSCLLNDIDGGFCPTWRFFD